MPLKHLLAGQDMRQGVAILKTPDKESTYEFLWIATL